MVALLLAGACSSAGGGSEDDDDGTRETPQPSPASGSTAAGEASCEQVHRLAVFDFFGTLTDVGVDAGSWISDPSLDPGSRPGARDVVGAYRELGYEVLYMSTVPSDVQIAGMAAPEAMISWLDQHGFPTGEGTDMWTWDGVGDVPTVSMIDELVRRAGDGTSVEHGYTENADKARSLAAGGIPAEGVHTLDEAATVPGTTPVPDNDLVAHVASVRTMPPVCRRG